MFLKNNHFNRISKLSLKNVFFDMIALVMIFSVFAMMALAAHEITLNISNFQHYEIDLSPIYLPYYILLSLIRIFVAVLFSMLFALIIALFAAKNSKAEQIIIPLLDILQSIPILGYISFTVTFFISLSPSHGLGLEYAVIFALFTSQVWNMTFSLYQSLITLPSDLDEASKLIGLSPWEKFWRVELPFAIPGLIWNTMISVSASWFFIVASETISVGDIKFSLPGIGSYLATAITHERWDCIVYVILSMLVVIIAYSKLIFKPMIIWSHKFSYDSNHVNNNDSMVIRIFKNSRFLSILSKLIATAADVFIKTKMFNCIFKNRNIQIMPLASKKLSRLVNWVWYAALCMILLWCSYLLFNFLNSQITFDEIVKVFKLGFITLSRIYILLFLTSLIFVPLGVYIGLRPNLTAKSQSIIQFLSAFPVNILFPVFVIIILKFNLNADVFLSPLIIIGSQWYILFNTIAGAAVFPSDFKDAAVIFKTPKLTWWRKIIIPGILPYLVTGLMTAAGGAWNASIVAEAVSWGSNNIYATGLGAYITQKTITGDFQHIALGIVVMALYVILLNNMLWKPLFHYSKAKMRLG